MARQRLLVPLPFAVVPLVALGGGQPGQVDPFEDAPDPGLADLDVVVALEVHGDLRRAEVVVLPQVDDLPDDLAAGLMRTVPRPPGNLAGGWRPKGLVSGGGLDALVTVPRRSGAGRVASPVRPGKGRLRGLRAVLRLRRRLRTSSGTVHRSAMIFLACSVVTGLPLLSQITYGVPRLRTAQARSARWLATTQQASRWVAPRSVICWW